jgi:hypothetical protein
MSSSPSHRIGQSALPDTAAAVRALYAAIAQPDTGLVLFFCSRLHDLDTVAREMSRLFGEVPVVGCTTAGEIGPLGCTEHTISGLSLNKNSFATVVGCIDSVQQFDLTEGRDFIQALQQGLQAQHPQATPENSFALMLIDGLSMREERVTRSLQNALGQIQLIGGSAGDGMDFKHTMVYADGRFATGRAVVLLISTPLPFHIFKIQHFVPTAQRLVVTSADSSKRLVREINGLPAALAYANLIGVPVESLSATHFAASPLMVLINGAAYIRSIQKAQADGSLTFFCAIEEGIVLRMAQGEDMVSNMATSFAGIRQTLGEPALTLAFDCILRKLESIRNDATQQIAEVFMANHAVGLNTYGEQLCGVHVTQTLTGVAIGARYD